MTFVSGLSINIIHNLKLTKKREKVSGVFVGARGA